MISLKSIYTNPDGSIVIQLEKLLSDNEVRVHETNYQIHEIIYFPELVLGSSWPVPSLLQQAINVNDGFETSDFGTFIHCRIASPDGYRIVERFPDRMMKIAFGLVLMNKTLGEKPHD
jgi:hypothetical protein